METEFLNVVFGISLAWVILGFLVYWIGRMGGSNE